MAVDPDLLDVFIDVALKVGPHIFEAWACPECKVENFCLHRFEEVLSCEKCGHRVASKVPLYRFAMNEAADAR